MSESQGSPMTYSQIESERFGYRIFRGKLEQLDHRAISKALLANDVDIAMLRIPSSRQSEIARLAQTGFPLIVADTLVYYRVDLAQLTPRPVHNQDLEFVLCRPEHAPELAVLVREIFQEYRNHYSSNPLLAPKDILDATVDWAVRHAAAESAGRTCWLVRRKGANIAFAACSFVPEFAEGVLYGVRQSASGGGVYGDLIHFTQQHFKQQDFPELRVSTQTQNLAVQTVWNREGFCLLNSYTTIHINSLLQRSVVPKRTIDVRVSADDIAACGRYSGDMNPLHFDDAFARGVGFEGRIAHGLILSSLISKYYGTEYPGPGTIFTGYSYRFMKPVYPERHYQLTISFPHIDEARGVYRSLVKLTDESGAVCLLSYNDLSRRPTAKAEPKP